MSVLLIILMLDFSTVTLGGEKEKKVLYNKKLLWRTGSGMKQASF